MHAIHDFLYAAISFVIVLGIMVVVHEFGHFAAAKLCRVRVEAFAVGFGPRLLGIVRGGTDYRLNALPFGGYVKMAGELPGEERSDDPGDFQNHPRWQRMIIGLAGPFANFVLAFVLMAGFYMLHNQVPDFLTQPATLDWVAPESAAGAAGLEAGDRITSFDGQTNPSWEMIDARAHLNSNGAVAVTVERNGQPVTTHLALKTASGDLDLGKIGLLPVVQPGPVVVYQVSPGSPVASAGIRPGDLFLSVDGHSFHGQSAFIAYVQSGKGSPLHLTVGRGGQSFETVVTPVKTDIPGEGVAWRIGFNVTPPPSHVEQMALMPAIAASVTFNREQSGLVLAVLERLLGHRLSVDNLSGPIGIAQQTGAAAESHDAEYIIKLMTMISINLGILNLMPFPILDGGMILFLLIESFLRRDIDLAVKERVYQAAFVLIILFAVYISFNDIMKIAIHRT